MVINIEAQDEPKNKNPLNPLSASQDITKNIIEKAENSTVSLQTLLFNKLGIANSSNPFICIFHILFKGLAVSSYIFGGWTFESVPIFLLVAIFTLLDFWVVKNVSGRCF